MLALCEVQCLMTQRLRHRGPYQVEITVQFDVQSTSSSNAAVQAAKKIRKFLKEDPRIHYRGISMINSIKITPRVST